MLGRRGGTSGDEVHGVGAFEDHGRRVGVSRDLGGDVGKSEDGSRGFVESEDESRGVVPSEDGLSAAKGEATGRATPEGALFGLTAVLVVCASLTATALFSAPSPDVMVFVVARIEGPPSVATPAGFVAWSPERFVGTGDGTGGPVTSSASSDAVGSTGGRI